MGDRLDVVNLVPTSWNADTDITFCVSLLHLAADNPNGIVEEDEVNLEHYEANTEELADFNSTDFDEIWKAKHKLPPSFPSGEDTVKKKFEKHNIEKNVSERTKEDLKVKQYKNCHHDEQYQKEYPQVEGKNQKKDVDINILESS